MVPGLAESWKALDATTWEFKLRRNVKFHDGTPFTADDVLFSMERNDQYWGQKPVWQRVTFRGLKSDPSRVAALLAGDVDLIEEVPATDLERLKKEPKVTVAQVVSNRIIYLHLDHFRDDSPFVRAKDGGPIKNPLRDV